MKFINIFFGDGFSRFTEGNQEAFRMVFDYFSPIIHRYIISKCKNAEDAEELTQEVFVQLFLHRHKIQSEENLYPYLFVIAKRLTISHFRKQISLSNTMVAAQSDWSYVSTETEEKIDAAELAEILEKIIDSLPPQQQEVYKLSKLEDMPQKDIANQMGISRNTVRNHLALATKMVRVKLQDIYFAYIFIKFFF